METAMIDKALIWNSLPDLLHGASISLQITFIAGLIGLTLGSVFAIGETSKSKMISFVISCYVAFFRGTPMLIQILFIFYVLPQFGITIPSFWTASIAIGLNSCAYISQILRSGISAVGKGQIEAARALGFNKIKTIRYIVFPQAFRVALPALGNEMITLIKDSSLASIIGVMELTKEGSIIRSRTYDGFSILLAVACIYLILTTTVSLFLKHYEKRLKRYV